MLCNSAADVSSRQQEIPAQFLLPTNISLVLAARGKTKRSPFHNNTQLTGSGTDPAGRRHQHKFAPFFSATGVKNERSFAPAFRIEVLPLQQNLAR